MSHLPQIFAGLWHSADSNLSATFESAKFVDTRWTCLLGSAKVQFSDRQEIRGRDDSCKCIKKLTQFCYGTFEANRWRFSPLSDEFVHRSESQLHFINDSAQLRSIPHWQVCSLVLLPDQKYCGLPNLSFHQEKASPLKLKVWAVIYYRTHPLHLPRPLISKYLGCGPTLFCDNVRNHMHKQTLPLTSANYLIWTNDKIIIINKG